MGNLQILIGQKVSRPIASLLEDVDRIQKKNVLECVRRGHECRVQCHVSWLSDERQ